MLDLRSSILGAKGGSVLTGWGVEVVAFENFALEILVDGTGLIADFDLSQPWYPKEEILIVDEALILWQAFVVVPHFPVHAVEERPLCELQSK